MNRISNLSNLKYVKAPFGWSYTDQNPFSKDGAYGFEWTAFCLLDCENDQFFTGQSGDGPFSARFGRQVDHLAHRLADFLLYENAQGRTVIISFPQEMDIDSYVTEALSCTPNSAIVRPEDSPLLVHATTLEAWKSIQSDGELKAASLLVHNKHQLCESGMMDRVAEYLIHEPPEYRDYIMFGGVDSCVPEIVVASYQTGAFVSDVNTVFQPGVRLYFDNHRIIRDHLGTRDGLHVMKVHTRLPLEPYLLTAIGVNDIDPAGTVNTWTISAFVESANKAFRRRTG